MRVIGGAEVGGVARKSFDGTVRGGFACWAVAGRVGFLKLSDVGVSVVVGVDIAVVMMLPVPASTLASRLRSTVTLASNIATQGTLDTCHGTDIALVSGRELYGVISRLHPGIEWFLMAGPCSVPRCHISNNNTGLQLGSFAGPPGLRHPSLVAGQLPQLRRVLGLGHGMVMETLGLEEDGNVSNMSPEVGNRVATVTSTGL